MKFLSVLFAPLLMSFIVYSQESPLLDCNISLQTRPYCVVGVDEKNGTFTVQEVKTGIGPDVARYQKISISNCKIEEELLEVSGYNNWYMGMRTGSERNWQPISEFRINEQLFHIEIDEKKGVNSIKIRKRSELFKLEKEEKEVVFEITNGDVLKFNITQMDDGRLCVQGIGFDSELKGVALVFFFNPVDITASNPVRYTYSDFVKGPDIFRGAHVNSETGDFSIAYTVNKNDRYYLYLGYQEGENLQIVELGNYASRGVQSVKWIDHQLVNYELTYDKSTVNKNKLNADLIQVMTFTENVDSPIALENFTPAGESIDKVEFDLEMLLKGKTAEERLELKNHLTSENALPSLWYGNMRVNPYDAYLNESNGQFYLSYMMDWQTRCQSIFTVSFDRSGKFKWHTYFNYQMYSESFAQRVLIPHINSEGNYVLFLNDSKLNYDEKGDYTVIEVPDKKNKMPSIYDSKPAYVQFDMDTGEFNRNLIPECNPDEIFIGNVYFSLNDDTYLYIGVSKAGVPGRIVQLR